MDMASLLAAQQLLSSPNSNLTAGQQQQLLASMSSSLAQLTTSQQQQLLASLTGMSMQNSGSSSSITGLTTAQQQLLAAAGTSLTSVSGKDPYSRSSTPSTPTPSGTPRPTGSNTPRPPAPATPTSIPSSLNLLCTNGALDPASQTKYQQLLSVIEEMSKDIRPCYAGSKSSAERLKRGIVYARILVRECLVEAERSARS
ncbi:cyclin-dependent kinase 2-associated protein 2 [Eurytemora carolleeae]|uniref:cyclin-dependent kinase 2-associated protein 2 n=1 Tax=Eurytemora carolleeae TaxID=1294199 RepID=UPI000C77CB9E|nr:cyclin-dependent kinase 2-associated protein 2 [Eurytemora carolleeae]XP_023336472.1 cyclin-dependent kinase 2-associated protein 2 [Eurytemora carolleeae]|eukprot:XP_023336470.1 cyclin-dependent kinase 2-associated protein 2-like [Eurytemora affinis]